MKTKNQALNDYIEKTKLNLKIVLLFLSSHKYNYKLNSDDMKRLITNQAELSFALQAVRDKKDFLSDSGLSQAYNFFIDDFLKLQSKHLLIEQIIKSIEKDYRKPRLINPKLIFAAIVVSTLALISIFS